MFISPDLSASSLIGWKYSAISARRFWSKPVSYSVPLNVSTITSVAGCDVPIENGDIAVSIISAPASTALRYVIEATPDV